MLFLHGANDEQFVKNLLITFTWLTDLFVFAIDFVLSLCFHLHLFEDLRPDLTVVHIHTETEVDIGSSEISGPYLVHFAAINKIRRRDVSSHTDNIKCYFIPTDYICEIKSKYDLHSHKYTDLPS